MSETTPNPKRSFFTRERLRLFVIVSIALHFITFGSWTTYVKVQQYLEEKEIQAKAEAERRKLEALADAAKKAEEIKKAETKQEIVAKTLKPAFDALVEKDLSSAEADALFSELMDELDGDVNEVADMAEDGASSADLSNSFGSLKRKMANALNRNLQAQEAKRITKDFLDQIRNGAVDKLADAYRKEIEAKVGQPLARDAGLRRTADAARGGAGPGDDRQRCPSSPRAPRH